MPLPASKDSQPPADPPLEAIRDVSTLSAISAGSWLRMKSNVSCGFNQASADL